MLIVQKYGGSSVSNAERMDNVAKRIVSYVEKGYKLVVILSAKGDTTDELTKDAQNIIQNGSKREIDMLLTTGEQQSIALMALNLQKLGISAISLNAYQAGIISTRTHSSARIKAIKNERIKEELENGKVVLIAGFQGVNYNNDLTTLGRGGSDTTAVAIAASMNASLCEIYTDVDGVYSADPRIVPNAVKLKEISYFEMLECAALGAKVLQKRSVGLAKKYGVRLVVRSSFSDAEGTLIKEERRVEGVYISGVAVDSDISFIVIKGIDDAPGVWFKVFSILNSRNISIDFIHQQKFNNKKDISFTVSKEYEGDVLEVLEENKNKLGFDVIEKRGGIAKLSVISSGMATHPGVPSMMFEALFDAGINIENISKSEIHTSVLIDERDAKYAANAVHSRFLEENYIAR